MDPLVIFISIVVLLAVVAAVLGLAGSSGKGTLDERLDTYRRAQMQARPSSESSGSWLRHRTYSGLPLLNAFFAQLKGSDKVALQLERAGVPLRVGEYYMIRYGLAGLLFLVPFIFNQTVLALFLGLGLAVVGYMLPALQIESKKKARTRRANAQLVEMLGLVANSLKSGYGLMQSFEFASRQMGPPLALELRRMLREANLGLSAEQALDALGQRVDSPDLDMVLTAINIQRSVGGNLAEILEKVAFTMRERERIRGDIRTLTAQQTMSAVLIGALPVGVGLLFMLINPSYMTPLFTEPIGRLILLAAAALEVLGALALKRVTAIEV